MIVDHLLSTSGGELLKFIDKKKVKIIKLPVHSKNPLIIFINFLALVALYLLIIFQLVMLEVEHLLGHVCLQPKLLAENLLLLFMGLIILVVKLKNFIIL